MSLRRANSKPWSNTSILFVHGVGEQPEGYSDKLIELLCAQDPDWAATARWYELSYDGVNDLMAQKCRGFWDKVKEFPGGSVGETHLIDLINFFAIKDAHDWIGDLFRFELASIVKDGQVSTPPVHQPQHRVFIIAHSLGTFVTYEGLHGIIGDATTLGVSKGLVVKNLFTMGCPLGVIRSQVKKLPLLAGKFAIASGLGRPTEFDPMEGARVSNIEGWLDYRHHLDPIAIVSVSSQAEPGTLSEPERTFDAFHSGANMHEFSNYVTEYSAELVGRMK